MNSRMPLLELTEQERRIIRKTGQAEGQRSGGFYQTAG